jgi:hypothetical protein
MSKKRYKVIPSLTMAIGVLFIAFLSWTMLYITYFTNCFSDDSVPLYVDIITISMLGIMPLLMIIIVAPKWYTLIVIDETGIRSMVFGFIKYKEIKWAEIEEIRFVMWIGGWIFISKRSLENITYNNIMKRRDQIQLTYDRKMIKILRQFTDKKITDLPAEASKCENK